MPRTSVAALLLCAVLLVAAPAHAAEEIVLTQPVDSLSFFPIYVARSLGYFQDEGINLRMVSSAGGGPHIQAVLSGRAQFTASPGSYQLNALKTGQKLIGVVNLLHRNVIGVVIRKDVAKRLEITETTPFEERIKKLKGVTLGMTRAGALTDNMAVQLVKMAGYDPGKDVRIIGVGGATAMVAALESGKIDAMFISTPHPERAIGDGVGTWLVNNAKGDNPRLREFMMSALMTTPEYADQRPDVVRKMVRAVKRALTYIAEKPLDDVVKTVEPFFGARVKPMLLWSAVETVKAATAVDGTMSQEAVDATVRLLHDAGKEMPDYTLKDVFTDRFLKEVK